jgi:hypothetical protein
MRTTKRQLRRIIREALHRSLLQEADEDQMFTGEEGRWKFGFSPSKATWELQADGEKVATGEITKGSPIGDFVGPKGTELSAAVWDYYQKADPPYGPTALPENEKEGWSIEFDANEEDDPNDLGKALKAAESEMMDEWG